MLDHFVGLSRSALAPCAPSPLIDPVHVVAIKYLALSLSFPFT